LVEGLNLDTAFANLTYKQKREVLDGCNSALSLYFDSQQTRDHPNI